MAEETDTETIGEMIDRMNSESATGQGEQPVAGEEQQPAAEEQPLAEPVAAAPSTAAPTTAAPVTRGTDLSSQMAGMFAGAPSTPETKKGVLVPWAQVEESQKYQQGSTEVKKALEREWTKRALEATKGIYKKKQDITALEEAIMGVTPKTKTPERGLTGWLNDLYVGTLVGGRQLTGSIGSILYPTELYGGDPSSLTNIFSGPAQSVAAKKTAEGYSEAQKDAAKFYDEEEEKGKDEVEKLQKLLSAAGKRPGYLAVKGFEQIPNMAAVLLTTRGLGSAAKLLGWSEKAATVVMRTAASVSSGALEAGQGRQQVVEQLSGLTEKDWERDPEYARRVAAGETKDAVKRDIAYVRSWVGGLIGAATGVAFGGAIPGLAGFEESVIKGGAKGVLKKGARAGVEVLGELPSELGTTYEAVRQEREFKPEVSPFKGQARAFVETLGAAGGPAVVAAALPSKKAPGEEGGAGEAGATPGGAPAAPGEVPPGPPGPPGPPASFREDVDRRVAALDERIAAAQEDVSLTDDQRAEVVRGVEAERASWLKAREEHDNTAPVKEAKAEVERLEREVTEIEQRPIDEDTKAKQIGARTTRAEELKSLLGLNELSESELEVYAKARREAIQDADAKRGIGARVDVPRLEREANFSDRVLLERALVETPSETAFFARARTSFELDESGNPRYPTAADIDNKDSRSGLDLAADVAQARIWQPRNNKTYTRAEKATLIRQARETAARLDRARAILDAPAEQIPEIREQLVQSMIEVGRRRGNFDQGRVTELAAVLAREADARGEKITLGQAKGRALAEIQRLLIEEGVSGPPPAGAAPPAPAPGTDPGPGGKGVGYDVVGGWLIYTSVRVGDYGRAPDKAQRNTIVDALRKAFSIVGGLVADAAQSLNVRWLQNTDPGSHGWYMPSRNAPWLHGLITTDTTGKRTENDVVHTTTHETGHAIDDVRRSGRYLSEESGALAQGTALRKELEATDAKTVAETGGLDFGYPLRWGVSGNERLKQIELFAQIIGYYHSARQDLAREAPLAHALAKEIVDGLNKLAATGRPGQQPVADVVSAALASVGNATGAPAAPVGPAGPAPAGVGPGPGGAGPGVAAAVREPGPERQAAVLRGVEDGQLILNRQATFLGPDAARAANTATVVEAIDIAQREATAERAGPEGAAARAEAGRAEPVAREPARAAPAAGARPAAPGAARGAAAPREGARPAAERRAPEAPEARRPVEGRPEQAVKPVPIDAADTGGIDVERTETNVAGEYPRSDKKSVLRAIADLFGIEPAQVQRALPGVRFITSADLPSQTFTGPDGSQFTAGAFTAPNGKTLPVGENVAAFNMRRGGKSLGLVFITDRMLAGNERGMFLHEVYHRNASELLPARELDRLRGMVYGWRDAKPGSQEREVYDAVKQRLKGHPTPGATPEGRRMTLRNEVVTYAIEEAAARGIDIEKLAEAERLGTGLRAFVARFANAVKKALAAIGFSPKLTMNDLVAAAYGAANLELPAARIRVPPSSLRAGARPEALPRRSVGLDFSAISPDYATPKQAANANAQAPAPGPIEPAKSIYEVYSPKTAAPIKTRKQLSQFIKTKDQPTTAWAPQFRDQFIENWQDYQRPFYAWLRDNVLSLAPWQQLKLIPGKLKAMTDRFTREIADPLAKDINSFAQKYKLDTSTASDALGYWAMFRHIPEANAALRDKLRARIVAGERGAAEALRAFDQTQAGAHPEEGDPKRAQMAGGLTDAEANAYRQELERDYKIADLQEVGDKIVAGFASMKQEAAKSGQISQDALKRFPKFKHYVALTGLPWDDTASDGFGTYVAPNLLREREGRVDTVADQSIKALMDRIGRVSAYSSSLDFKKSLNDIYENAGGKDNKIGLARMESQTAQTPIHSDIVYQEKDGKRYIFRFENEKVADALIAKNKEYADNGALRIMDRLTRAFSRAYTTWTAAFGPVNTWRDVNEKAILIRSRNVRDQEGNMLDANKVFARVWANAFTMDTWRAAKQLAFNGKADESTRAGRLANELRDRGGISTLAQKLATGRAEIAKEAKKHAGFRKGVDKFVSFVESYNTMMEVVSTLSAHGAMRDLNVEPNEAAFQALDLMNFQNQGAKTKWLRSMFAFFNPAVQSGRNLIMQMGTKRGQRDAMIGLALASVLYTLSRATGDDDEELGNEMDQRGTFEAERNVVVKLGGTIYKFPVPFGLAQHVWSTVVNTGRYATGRYTAADALAQQAASTVKMFSPVSPSEVPFTESPLNAILKTVTPSIFKGAVDMVTDTNAWGQKLTAYYPQEGKFASEQGRAKTPQLYKDIADNARNLTGWDLYPEQWRALMEGIAWGPAGYLMKSIADSNAEMEGRKKDQIDEIPGAGAILRVLGAARFVGGQSRYVEGAYHDTYSKALVDVKQLNEAKARGTEREWRAENPEKAQRAAALSKQKQGMTELAKDYNATVKDMRAEKIDLTTGAERLGRIQDKRDALMREFLRANKQRQADY